MHCIGCVTACVNAAGGARSTMNTRPCSRAHCSRDRRTSCGRLAGLAMPIESAAPREHVCLARDPLEERRGVTRGGSWPGVTAGLGYPIVEAGHHELERFGECRRARDPIRRVLLEGA